MKLLLTVIFVSCSALASECPSRPSLRWVMSEFEGRHPRLILQQLATNKVRAQEAEAGKKLNPELEHFSVWGKEFAGVRAYQNETRLWFTLQLSNKRGKRLEAWASEYQLAQHEERQLAQALLKDVWLNFFRLHQINQELHVKGRLIAKIRAILKSYDGRRYLSNDQQLEESIFSMVVRNFELGLVGLKRERLDTLGFLRDVTGNQCALEGIEAEEDDIKWPEVPQLRDLAQAEPLNLKLARLNADFAAKSTLVADAAAVPNLRLSPVFQSYVNGEVNNLMAGLSFVIPIPVFDANRSERSKALLVKSHAERMVEVTRVREAFQWEENLLKYGLGREVLLRSETVEQNLAVFDRARAAYGDGKLTLSNLVEFCRQLDELVSIHHRNESSLIRDLLNLYEQKDSLNRGTLEALL